MKFKKNSEYAIRILMALSNEKNSYDIHTLLDSLKIPESSGIKVLKKLRSRNLISKDFLSLKIKKREINLLEIIECFEKIELIPCIDTPNSCKFRYGNCSACFEFFDLRDAIKQMLSKKTIGELCSKQKKIEP